MALLRESKLGIVDAIMRPSFTGLGYANIELALEPIISQRYLITPA
jgi:hypothetical protein